MDSFFGIGIFELFMIAVIALVVLGPERLPGAMREVAKYARQLRDVSNEFQSQFSEELKVLDEINPRKIISSAMDPATPPAKPSTTAPTPAQPAKSAPPKPAPAAKPLQPAAPAVVAAATAPVANGDAGNTILPPKAATPGEVANTPDPAPVVEDIPPTPPLPDSSAQPASAPDTGPAPEESR